MVQASKMLKWTNDSEKSIMKIWQSKLPLIFSVDINLNMRQSIQQWTK